MKKKLCSEFNSRQYMLARDFEIYYYSDLHFQSVGLHSHPYTEVYLFCEGEVDMEIAGKRTPLRPGDVLVLPPETQHRAVLRRNDIPYRRFVFWISKEFSRTLREESEDYLYLFERAERKKEYVYPMASPEFNSLRGQLLQLLEEMNTDSFGRDTQITLSVRELLLYLNRSIWRRTAQKSEKAAHSSYQLITDYIRSNLSGDLSLEALSRELFLSKYYIAHLFQEKLGLPIHQYITKKRLSACVDAMQSGRHIKEIYGQFGFLNYSSFYRAFLKEYGCSPSIYLNERISSVSAKT